MNLSGLTALVTGGAVRIGRGICEALAREGCNVAIHCNKSVQEAEDLKNCLEGTGISAWVVRGDLSEKDECVRIMRDAVDVSGGIDVLVNNASIFYRDRDNDQIERGTKINYQAPIFLIEEFVEALAVGKRQVAGRKGKVVNLLDRRIVGEDPEFSAYQETKRKLAEFTKSAAIRLAPDMTINGVAPGAILPPVGAKGDMAGNVPLDYKCTVEDVADAVIYFLKADAVTGQVLFVDGGRHLL